MPRAKLWSDTNLDSVVQLLHRLGVEFSVNDMTREIVLREHDDRVETAVSDWGGDYDERG